MKKVLCPQCKKEVIWSKDSIFRPFCSERCKTMDLGAWANEDYKIETKDSPESLESHDSEDE